MPILQTTFEINAPVHRVWQVLMRFDHYAPWNPQIPQVSGTLQQGTKIQRRLALPGRPAMNRSATIEEAQPDRLLTW